MIDIDLLIKEATLSKDKVALNAYKNIKAEFEKFVHAQILERRLTEDISLRIIASYAKKLEDAIKQFSEARRDDLASEYTSELEVVKKLLPAPVNASDIHSFIENDETFFDKFWLTELDENSVNTESTIMRLSIPKKEMGNAIKFIKLKFPTADGKLIFNIVKEYII